jgi:hypothetical protein
MTDLAAAFDLFRRGHFAAAREGALAIIAGNPNSFWAFYLAAVSAAFEPDLREFEKYLAELEAFQTKNVYLNYLKAYYALLQRDIEKALWHYLEIADDAEGWLAKSLIKKFRKLKELKNIEFRVADFIVLPPELPPVIVITPHSIEQKTAMKSGWQFATAEKKAKRKPRLAWLSTLHDAFPYGKVFITGLIVFIATAAGVLIYQHRHARTQIAVPEMQIADSAAVMPVPDPKNILYRYRTRDAIIADFDRAKLLLKERKVNQSRFLLARLLNSNADFQTREKSRIYAGFISDPAYTEFNDNIALKELFTNIKLRRQSLVVVAGEVRDSASEPGGTLYQIIAKEDGAEYRLNVFKATSVIEEKANTKQAANQLQVYGRFKGVVGEQKAIYLEALRVWR